VSLVAECVDENSWTEIEVDGSLVLADGILRCRGCHVVISESQCGAFAVVGSSQIMAGEPII
jgi:hypothetical protein